MWQLVVHAATCRTNTPANMEVCTVSDHNKQYCKNPQQIVVVEMFPVH